MNEICACHDEYPPKHQRSWKAANGMGSGIVTAESNLNRRLYIARIMMPGMVRPSR